jgi:hypothetical protein
MTAHSESRDFLLPVDVSGPACLAGWSLMYDSLTFVEALMLADHRRLLCSYDHTIRPRGHTRKLALRPLQNLDTLQHVAWFPVIIGANWHFAPMMTWKILGSSKHRVQGGGVACGRDVE